MKCKIVIKDPVNIQLQNLDSKTRRLCKDALTFLLPSSRYMTSVRLGRWDGKESFCSIGGLTYLNLLPVLYPIIKQQGYDFEIEDHRQNHNFEFPLIDKNYFSYKTWGPGHKYSGHPIILEDHQVECVNTLLSQQNGLACASTGSGKTLLVAVLSHMVEKYGRSIIIVPSKDLVIQTETEYKNLGMDVGVFYGNRKELNKKHTICTWQSLDRLDKKNKDSLNEDEIVGLLNNAQMVVVDEAHVAPSKSLKSLLTGQLAFIPIRFGVTGTVPKEKHLYTSITATLGEVLYTVTAKELQEKNFLANCFINVFQVQDSNKFRDFTAEDQYISNSSQILSFCASNVFEISKTGNTFVLVKNISTGKKLQKLIPGSIFLSGSNDTKERKLQYDKMSKENNLVIIATFAIASTGINIVRIFNLVIFNPGKSFVKVIQSIGRSLRTAQDKNFANIYDICTSNKYSSSHLSQRKKIYKEAQYPFKITKIVLV